MDDEPKPAAAEQAVEGNGAASPFDFAAHSITVPFDDAMGVADHACDLESLTNLFVLNYGGDLRFVEQFGYWLAWSEPAGLWRRSNSHALNAAGRWLIDVCSHVPRESKKVRVGGLAGPIERRARAHLDATVEQWDADPMLLNTPGGVVDLATGVLRPAARDDYCTKITAAPPGDAGSCPLWMRFLDRITGDDAELQDFLQRAAGYCATGKTSEQCLFFLFGTGQNGKGVFINTISRILNTYAAAAAIETFTLGQFERHPEELAVLRGCRLVTASETEQGKAWNETRIKQLTGGDSIRARFMRMDSFEYLPRFKLLLSGNNKPELRSSDKAIRRRLHVIPFAVEIPDSERDNTLGERLVEEYPGILTWIIDGARKWLSDGLRPPSSVADATRDYIASEDAFAAWLEECTVGAAADHFTPVAVLFSQAAQESLFDDAMVSGWKPWAETRGEYVGSMKRFSKALIARGYHAGRNPRGDKRGFYGLMLKSAQQV